MPGCYERRTRHVFRFDAARAIHKKTAIPMKSVISRIIITVLAIGLWTFASTAVDATAPLISSKAAMGQLQDTDSGFIIARWGALVTGGHLSSGLLLLVLLAIWAGPVIKGLKRLAGRTPPSPGSLVALLFVILGGSSCHGYYDARDNEEYVTIKANQTAFLVPQQGANLQGQGAFDSAAYLEKNKIAEKRIQIPHMLLKRKGWTATDMYIPSAVLYVVTREPFVREWLKESIRGTSSKNEGFFLESAEGINIDFGVAISAHIKIEDSALYMFNLGTASTQADTSEFPSVVYARPLAEVMDQVVRARVQTLLAREFGSRPMARCITDKAESMAAVEKQVVGDFAKIGITIDYVGYASQLNFDKEIQDAINKVFLTKQEAEAAANQLVSIPVRTAIADITIKEGIGKGLEKWDGKLPALPSFMILTPEVINSVKSLFPGSAPLPTQLGQPATPSGTAK